MDRTINRVYDTIPIATVENVCPILYYVSDMRLRTFQEFYFITNIPLIGKLNAKKKLERHLLAATGTKKYVIKNSEPHTLTFCKNNFKTLYHLLVIQF